MQTISEFGSINVRRDRAFSKVERSSSELDDDDSDSPLREGRSTLSSFAPFPSRLGQTEAPAPSLELMRSQFDDSDDDDKLEGLPHSISKVSNRARLAAIGTASRLFKGKRHSRNSSHTTPLKSDTPDRPAPLVLDKCSNKQHHASVASSSVLSGVSSVIRPALFNHHSAPSELGSSSQEDRSRIVASTDRDLIRGLQGGPIKTRSKPVEQAKALPSPPDHNRPSHRRQVSVDPRPAYVEERHPPPYCASHELRLRQEANLRKSQSSTTLRSDARYPQRSTSPLPDVAGPQAIKQLPQRAHHVERSAWEAMLDTPPSTVSDHSSTSCTRNIQTQAPTESPRKRFPQRLPPQKPPPQTCLPPPPPSKGPTGDQPPSFASKISAEIVTPGDKAVPASDDGPLTCPAPLQRVSQAIPDRASSLRQDSQVTLDVGGTKYVTLVSTLQGAHGDKPRLLELLKDRREHRNPEVFDALCKDASLARRKRVDSTRPRAYRKRSDSDQSTRSALSQLSDVLDDASVVKKLTSELNAALDSMKGVEGSPSCSSLPASSSDSGSNSDSDASTCRTSDMSDASSWSKEAPKAENVHSTDEDKQDKDLSPHHLLPSPPPDRSSTTSPASPPSIFVDRNADLYRDLLDILRAHKLPYRLRASFVVASTSSSSSNPQEDGDRAIKFQLRCRLHEVKDEAEWLGYQSIVTMCEQELAAI
ncbi:BTB/POZ fold [Kalmanozyma brasiliensis GHG001]|uniref:BTB/POZ fold n=1 Tax=Kalmanozyma brasiliensis (strain GHG001) TaxID=1365824 RepID=UPI002867DC2A|nr:BTB/POZ fold [Kalmanozyma brasiliensis GHG001]KAF6766896.1 BTB/POZ fold [Kalmanozyma brasiliensis GHG001]